MRTKLRMKCSKCCHWNKFEVEKIMVQPENSEPEGQVFIYHYMPLKEEKCSKCGSTIAEAKTIIKVTKS